VIASVTCQRGQPQYLILDMDSPATSHVAGFVILILVDQSS
jgi:hypothetical protein